MSSTIIDNFEFAVEESNAKLYQDEDWLATQYCRKGWTQAEIAELAGCSRKTVCTWIGRLGLRKPEAANFQTTNEGYEQWRCLAGGTCDSTTVHRLLATLLVDDLDELDGKHVHHKSHIPWDNRLENLQVMDPDEHRKHHNGDGEPETPE